MDCGIVTAVPAERPRIAFCRHRPAGPPPRVKNLLYYFGNDWYDMWRLVIHISRHTHLDSFSSARRLTNRICF